MTTINQRNIIPGTLLGAAVAPLYTVPDLTSVRVINSSVTNDTAGNVALTVHVVGPGGVVSSANKRISAHVLVPGETYLCNELLNRVLGPGDSIHAGGLDLSMDVSAFTRA